MTTPNTTSTTKDKQTTDTTTPEANESEARNALLEGTDPQRSETITTGLDTTSTPTDKAATTVFTPTTTESTKLEKKAS